VGEPIQQNVLVVVDGFKRLPLTGIGRCWYGRRRDDRLASLHQDHDLVEHAADRGDEIRTGCIWLMHART
jgi:hypothetical protein